VILSDGEIEQMETKKKIQRQLMKIVHRTWYIFDPEKQKQVGNTFKAG
jgi:hypothetical protein